MPGMLELQDLYSEALAREILEKTKRSAIVWSFLGGTQFHATETDAGPPTINWDFYITETQIGNLTFKYSLDVKKNQQAYLTILDGPLPYTNRDSTVKQLYQTIELIVLQLDKKLKETLQFVQNLPGLGGI